MRLLVVAWREAPVALALTAAGRRRPVLPQPAECGLAAAAAAAVGADLAGVDLIPRPDGSFEVLEVNGAREFTAAYSLDDRDGFEAVLIALLLPESTEISLPLASPGA